MKTAEITEQISKIINPVRVLKVQEWMQIAEIALDDHPKIKLLIHERAIHFIKRYELLTQQPLTKEQFVCEEEPIKGDMSELQSDPDWQKEWDDYYEAQEKLWFAGFESDDSGLHENLIFHAQCSLQFTPKGVWVNNEFIRNNSTVFDFIIEVDRYNRTATNKIPLYWTQNFIKELLK